MHASHRVRECLMLHVNSVSLRGHQCRENRVNRAELRSEAPKREERRLKIVFSTDFLEWDRVLSCFESNIFSSLSELQNYRLRPSLPPCFEAMRCIVICVALLPVGLRSTVAFSERSMIYTQSSCCMHTNQRNTR